MPRQRRGRVPIPGTEAPVDLTSRDVGAVDDATIVRVTVIVRPRPDGRAEARRQFARFATSARSRRRRPVALATAEVAAIRGASPADVAGISAFARDYGLAVADVNVAARSIALVGTAYDLSKAFGATLRLFRVGRRTYRGRTGSLTVPVALNGVVRAVLGFETRPFFTATRPGSRSRRPMSGSGGASALARTPPEVARLYGLRVAERGSGQCIAIIEVNQTNADGVATGGGFSATELDAYFVSLGLAPPVVTAVSVDGGINLPGVAWSVDEEVMLDIEIAGAVAHKAEIAVYFCPDTDAAFQNAFATAIYDDVHRPSVISNSWAGAEFRWLTSAMVALDELLEDAALRGVTVCSASGDYGSSGDEEIMTRQWADFPPSSPNVLACGGTKLQSIKNRIASEVVWKYRCQGSENWCQASGGAISTTFGRPAYQAGSGVPRYGTFRGRGVPDVAGNADYDTGYIVRWVNGTTGVAGGTSCVAPLFSAFIAIGNEILERSGRPWLGFINPLLYGLKPGDLFYDVVEGDNDLDGLGVYSARVGWDACTGLGAPRLARYPVVLATL